MAGVPKAPKMPEPMDEKFQKAAIESNWKQEEDAVIKSGAFRDGYHFGDVSKTFAGTLGDVGVNAAKGFYKGFEGLVDLGLHGASNAASLVGANNAADWLKNEAMADSSKLVFGKAEDYFDQYSGLGNKGDAIAEMLGYIGYIATLGKAGAALGGAVGAGATGASAATTIGSGASSMGHGITEAYQQRPNASAGQAWAYGLMKGAVDAGSELIFGGLGKGINALGYSRGLSSLDDMFAKKLSAGISNQFWKNMVQFGVKASAEGAEEVLAGLGTAVAKKLTYMSDEDLKKLVEDENLQEQFIMGAVVSGMMQSGFIPGTYNGSLLEANRTGTDLVGGTTANENQAATDNQVETQTQEPPVAQNAGENVSYAQDLADRLYPIQTAIDQFNQNGTVSNRVAEIILNNSQALSQIQEQTGVEISGTRSQQRNAVKQAVAQIVQQQAQEQQRTEMTEQEKNRANLDAAIKQTFGIDTKRKEAYNGNTTQGGMKNGTGEYQNDGRTGAGNPAQGLAGVQSADRAEPQRRGEYGGLAGDSGILRISKELETAQQNKGTLTYPVRDTTSTPERYEQALIAGRNSDTKNGWCVTPKSAQELKDGGVRTFMNADGTVGAGIAPNGDIVAVFKNKNGGPKKALDTLMPIAIEQGGDRLDCYGEILVGVYAQYGFEPICRVEFNPVYANEGWTPDKGTPYIYFMAHNGDSAAAVAQKMHTYQAITKEQLDALPTYGKEDYDAAMEYRDSLLEKKGTETESVGAAPKGFTDFKGEYYDQLTDKNAQPDRPGDVRPMEVLKEDKSGHRVSEFAANAYGAEVTTDEMADRIQELINDGALGFDTRSNKESLKQAHEAIKTKGAAAIRSQITNHVANGKLQDGDIEKAMLLYADYAGNKTQAAQDNAAELMVDLATMANMTGRNLQMFKMLRRMTPEGQYMTIQKTVDRYVEGINKKRGDAQQAEVSIPAELRDAYIEAARNDLVKQTAETEQAKAEAEQEIIKAAAAQIKASTMEKLNAWRYMAMLGNVKTQARNIIGNLAFRPLVDIKRNISAAIQSVTLDQEQRTTAMLGVGKEAKALLEWARNDAKNPDVQKLMAYTARTGDEVNTQLSEMRKIYDTEFLEATREFVQKVPEVADGFFKRWEYEVSLASFIKARGYTSEQLNAGEVPEAVINEGREYATLEAMKATFNDMNAFSNVVVNLRAKGNSKTARAINIMAEGILPFRRTPANIVKRSTEYSPVGLTKGIINAAFNVKNGKVSAATAIDQMAAGLTGTGMMALGYQLAKMGILKGTQDEDDEKKAGKQGFAIQIGGKSFSIDWIAPANIPFFVGANAYDSFHDKDNDASGFVKVLQSFSGILDPILELSCLSSLQDMFNTARYTEGGTEIMALVASATTSYLNQYIPTLFGQLEQTFEGEKKTTYTDADTGVGRVLQRAAASASQKIPGVDLYQTEKLDQWGNPVERGNFFQRAFDALINPSKTSDISRDPVDVEIQRLNDAQVTFDATNKGPESKLSYKDTDGNQHEDYRLSGEEWEAMQQAYGQTAHKVLQELIGSDGYALLTDEQKAKAFEYAYAYAREAGRMAALENYPGYNEAWMEGIEGNEATTIVTKVTAWAFGDALNRVKNAWKYGKPTTEGVEALQQAYSIYDGMSDTKKKSLLESLTGDSKHAINAMDAGLTAAEFADVYTMLQGITAEPDYKEVRTVQKVEVIADADGLSESERQAVMKLYLSDSQDEALDRVTNAGYTAEMYAAVYRIYSDSEPKDRMEAAGYGEYAEGVKDICADNKTKERRVQAIMKRYGVGLAQARKILDAYTGSKEDFVVKNIMETLGVNKATATKIYELYTGK